MRLKISLAKRETPDERAWRILGMLRKGHTMQFRGSDQTWINEVAGGYSHAYYIDWNGIRWTRGFWVPEMIAIIKSDAAEFRDRPFGDVIGGKE